MRVTFRLADLFPANDVVSQFLVGVCMAVNDLTLQFRHMQQAYDAAIAEPGENNYHLYLTCAYYREAMKFLQGWLDDEHVAAFLDDLSPEGRAYLETVTESFTPWDGSFVKEVMRPVRNVVFHYAPRSPSEMRSCLERAADGMSHIEMGDGTYSENRYGFADDLLSALVVEAWGESVPELTSVMQRVGELVLAFMYFAHEAVTLRLAQVDPGSLEVTG